MLHLVQEPPVELGDAVDGLVVDAALEGLVHAEHTLGVMNICLLYTSEIKAEALLFFCGHTNFTAVP